MVTHQDACRVLIVDGYADASDSLALLLTYWGYNVRVAYSAPEALVIAHQHRPQIVLLELKLDGLDGYQLADRLRSEGLANGPLIALTGLGDVQFQRRARECGFHSFLVKPVEPEKIKKLLDRLAHDNNTEEHIPPFQELFRSGHRGGESFFRIEGLDQRCHA
jgi:CheY-like chemotaxis protein